jgi:hypothetical protein
MPESLSWTFATRVLHGPTIAETGELEVESYVKLNVTIADGATQEVEVFPGAGGAAQVLVISPIKPDAKLTYEVGGSAIALDGPHVLIGAGAVGFLGNKIGTLEFKNQTGEDAELSILAGRDATP